MNASFSLLLFICSNGSRNLNRLTKVGIYTTEIRWGKITYNGVVDSLLSVVRLHNRPKNEQINRNDCVASKLLSCIISWTVERELREIVYC